VAARQSELKWLVLALIMLIAPQLGFAQHPPAGIMSGARPIPALADCWPISGATCPMLFCVDRVMHKANVWAQK